MKVSGAVAMADDPGHAFGIYFEKIGSLPTGGSAPAVGFAVVEPVKFDAQEEKPHFNPSITGRMRAAGLEALKPGGIAPKDDYYELVDTVERVYRAMVAAQP